MKKHWMITLIIVALALTGCNAQQKEENDIRESFSLIEESIYTLADGTTIDLYHSKLTGYDVYVHPDGSILLRLQEGVYIQRSNDLSDAQRSFIEEYYGNLIPPYNIQTELEKSYELYQARKDLNMQYENIMSADDEMTYSAPWISPSIGVRGQNDTIICTEYYYSVPVALSELRNELSYTTEVTSYEYATVFHAQTGEVMSQYDLFTIPADEIPSKLLEYSVYIGDEVLWTDMIANLQPEYLCFGENGLSISFPGGMVGDGGSYSETIQYNRIAHILHSWAISETDE